MCRTHAKSGLCPRPRSDLPQTCCKRSKCGGSIRDVPGKRSEPSAHLSFRKNKQDMHSPMSGGLVHNRFRGRSLSRRQLVIKQIPVLGCQSVSRGLGRDTERHNTSPLETLPQPR